MVTGHRRERLRFSSVIMTLIDYAPRPGHYAYHGVYKVESLSLQVDNVECSNDGCVPLMRS